MERFKIKLPTDDAFQKALTMLEGEVPLYVRSEKRRSLSVGPISPEVQGRLRSLGGEVTVEQRYDLEEPASV